MSTDAAVDAAIRTLGPEDAAAYRALRLRGLREHPESFATSAAEEERRGEGETAARLGAESTTTLGAFHGARLVGIATLVLSDRERRRHRATLAAMYVDPAARGGGVGRRLLDAMLDAAVSRGAEEVELDVTVGNRAARALYAGAGFRAWGVQPRALRVDGAYHDVEAMILRFPRAVSVAEPGIEGARKALAASAAAIRALVADTEGDEARWSPAADRWSIVEVLNHLADEEAEDFRTRLDLVLHRPDAAWPPIDPEGWVAARRYGERDPAESLARFLRQRDASLAWLAALTEPDLRRTHDHPRIGSLSAGSILAAWVAHDLLHLRQLTRLRYEWLALRSGPDSLIYAGTW